MNTHPKITFIGGGNMARSLINGLLKNDIHATQIHVADPEATQREKLEQSTNVYQSNSQAAQQADVLILATKPQVCRQAIESIQPILAKQQPLLISIAAGIRIDNLRRWSGTDLAIVRVMPNTPALVGEALSALYANELCGDAHKQFCQQLMDVVGQTIWVDEENILDIVTGISGSGPAYYFKLMEIMIKTAESQGIAPQEAQKMVLQTALGAAKLAIHSSHTPAELRQQVTSPGGTTQAALEKMEQSGIDNIIESGVIAAIERSRALAKTAED